jgi:hypothetical protein
MSRARKASRTSGLKVGMIVLSRRHTGLIRIDQVSVKGMALGRKLDKDGVPGLVDVILEAGDVVAERLNLPGCEPQ